MRLIQEQWIEKSWVNVVSTLRPKEDLKMENKTNDCVLRGYIRGSMGEWKN